MSEEDLHEYVPPSRLRKVARRVVSPQMRERVRSGLLDRPVTHEVVSYLDPSIRWRRTRIADIVIDGMARSGNSYARCAFDYANDGRYTIASHMHSARPIEIAARRGIPAIVLIREPRAVFGSTVQYQRAEDPERVVRWYCNLYRRVLPLMDHVVLADFPEVVGDFGAVIERCNRRFGTSFTPYVKTPEAEAAVAAKIRGLVQLADPDRVEETLPLPSTQRRSADEVLAEMPAAIRAGLAEADSVYAEVMARASGS